MRILIPQIESLVSATQNDVNQHVAEADRRQGVFIIEMTDKNIVQKFKHHLKK